MELKIVLDVLEDLKEHYPPIFKDLTMSRDGWVGTKHEWIFDDLSEGEAVQVKESILDYITKLWERKKKHFEDEIIDVDTDALAEDMANFKR